MFRLGKNMDFIFARDKKTLLAKCKWIEIQKDVQKKWTTEMTVSR
jgi:hypothetical protein